MLTNIARAGRKGTAGAMKAIFFLNLKKNETINLEKLYEWYCVFCNDINDHYPRHSKVRKIDYVMLT